MLVLLLCSILSRGLVVANTAEKEVVGNGVIVTKTLDVSNFDELNVVVPAEIIYTQGDNYSCSVTLDENLFPYLDFFVKKGTLTMRLSETGSKPAFSMSFGEKELSVKNPKGVQMKYTKFVVEVTAPNLSEINLSSTGSVRFASDFVGEDLELNLASAGTITANKLVVKSLEAQIAGSGDIDIRDVLVSEDMEVEVTGSGIAKIAKAVVNDKFEAGVAGAGKVTAQKVTASHMKASMVGSGEISINAGQIDGLKVESAGSGIISVQGTINSANVLTAGSGDVKLGQVVKSLNYNIVGSGDIIFSGDCVTDGMGAGSGTIMKK